MSNTLMTTTSLGSSAQQLASITPITKLPDHTLVMQQARQAFEDDANHVKLLGSGVQRMTYAVMCEAYRGLADGSVPFKLADALTVADTRNGITSRLVLMFCSEKPDYAAVEKLQGSEAATAATKLFTAKAALVKRGVELAAIMATHSVPITAFNPKTGVFAAFPKMLYPANAEPAGRLKNDGAIALDGSPIVWLGKASNGRDLTGKGTASVSQVLSVCKPAGQSRKARPGAGTEPKVTSGATFDLGKFRDVAKHVSLPVLIAAAHQLMVVDRPAAPMRHADMPQAWNMLSKMMEVYDEYKTSKTWDLPADADDKLADRPVTKGKRKPGDEAVIRRGKAA